MLLTIAETWLASVQFIQSCLALESYTEHQLPAPWLDFLKLINWVYLFIWLHQVLVVTHRIF